LILVRPPTPIGDRISQQQHPQGRGFPFWGDRLTALRKLINMDATAKPASPLIRCQQISNLFVSNINQGISKAKQQPQATSRAYAIAIIKTISAIFTLIAHLSYK